MTNEQNSRVAQLDSRQLFISCVVPVLNEASLIQSFLTALSNTLKKHTDRYEIIVVDDGSRDQTSAIVAQMSERYPVKLVRFSRNFGKELAIAAGLNYTTGDVTILMDADFQHPLEYIPQFLKHWVEGYDMVYGLRNDRDNETLLKRAFTKVFYKALNGMSDVSIPPNAGDFRLLDRKVVASLNQCHERSRFNKGLFAWVGFNSIGIPFRPVDRPEGKSRWRFGRLAELALNGFLSFSNVPLRVCSVIGMLVSVLSILYGLYVVFYTMIEGKTIPGYPTIVTAILFLGGVQLISVGILGEYIARIFTEVKDRPPYVVQETIGFNRD